MNEIAEQSKPQNDQANSGQVEPLVMRQTFIKEMHELLGKYYE